MTDHGMVEALEDIAALLATRDYDDEARNVERASDRLAELAEENAALRNQIADTVRKGDALAKEVLDNGWPSERAMELARAILTGRDPS